MADVLENYEQDIHWLKSKKSQVSEADAEFFADKVALFVLDGESESRARLLALDLLNELVCDRIDLGW